MTSKLPEGTGNQACGSTLTGSSFVPCLAGFRVGGASPEVTAEGPRSSKAPCFLLSPPPLPVQPPLSLVALCL